MGNLWRWFNAGRSPNEGSVGAAGSFIFIPQEDPRLWRVRSKTVGDVIGDRFKQKVVHLLTLRFDELS